MEAYELPAEPFSRKASLSLACYKGHSKNLQQSVFVKSYSSISLALTNRFLNEAVAMASIEHPHNARLHEVKLTEVGLNCTLHLILEQMDKSLKEEIQERVKGNLPYKEAELLTFLCQVGSGLTRAKKKNLNHRNLKPSNILIDSDGAYKVADYQPHCPSPSHLYSSPQLRDVYCRQRADYDVAAADVYALGLITLHMAELVPLHRLHTFNDLQAKTDLEIGSLNYSTHFQQVLAGLLRVEETQRFTVERVVEAATQALGYESEEEEVCDEDE